MEAAGNLKHALISGFLSDSDDLDSEITHLGADKNVSVDDLSRKGAEMIMECYEVRRHQGGAHGGPDVLGAGLQAHRLLAGARGNSSQSDCR